VCPNKQVKGDGGNDTKFF